MIRLASLFVLGFWGHGAEAAEMVAWLPAETRMVVFVNDFRRAVQHHLAAGQQSDSTFAQRFGVTAAALAELVEGPLLRAELVAADGSVSDVCVGQVTAGAGQQLLERYAVLKQQGARVSSISIESHPGTVIRQTTAGGEELTSVHLLRNGHLILADRLWAAEAIAACIINNEQGLITRQSFHKLWNRVSPELAGDRLALAWYTDPWKRAKAGEDQPQQQALEDERFAGRHGITGIQGIGGSVVFDADGVERLQALAYAPRPLASSLRMAAYLEGDANLRLPHWVSDSVREAAVLRAQVDKALGEWGLLFDDVFADGIEGTYDEVLQDLKSADGLNVDVEQELYPLLGPRVYLLYGHREQRSWQPLVVAFETQDAARVAEILKILVQDDPEAREIVLGQNLGKVWHVPGERGGQDFVLGTVRGLAVYSNELGLVRTAMSLEPAQPLAVSAGVAAARQQTLSRMTDRASVLIARGSRAPHPQPQEASLQPLDLLFRGVRSVPAPDAGADTSIRWLPRGLTSLLAGHRVVFGFAEQDGWRFVARTDRETR